MPTVGHFSSLFDGKAVVSKTDIGSGFGFFVHFIHAEGNRIGLHSMG